MKRTTVCIDDDQARMLHVLSVSDGRAVADLVREAVSEYLDRRGMDPAARVSGPEQRADDEGWRSRFDVALGRVRDGVDPTWTSEQIEAEITAAREEVRRERASRRTVRG